MAQGDVVNGISAVNTALTLQPASGVEVLITSVAVEGIQDQAVFTNGTLNSGQISSGTGGRKSDQTNMKMFINNTNYLTIGALGASNSSGYTGIQTK